jgi:hypothetical protein
LAFFWIFEKSHFFAFLGFLKAFFEPPKVKIRNIWPRFTKFGMYDLCSKVWQNIAKNCEFFMGVTSKFFIWFILLLYAILGTFN